MSNVYGNLAQPAIQLPTVIADVEQMTGGDTVLTIGQAMQSGRLSGVETIRLTPAEREQLIQDLIAHRFADIADALNRE
jgi:hypothetical protein